MSETTPAGCLPTNWNESLSPWRTWMSPASRAISICRDTDCIHSEGTEEGCGAFRLPATGGSLLGLKLATCTTLISSITTDKENDHAYEEPAPSRSQRQRELLGPLGLSVTEAAEVLGVARHTLSRVLNGHAGISPDMAIRLEKAGWSSADFWMSRQTAFDLAQARKGEDRIRVERYQTLPTA